MRLTTKLFLSFNRLRRNVKVGTNQGLYRVAGLIRMDSRRSLRVRQSASNPGSPPHVRKGRGGLKEINFQVSGNQAIIGPRKFRNSNFFNRPVPNIHEKGGQAVFNSFKRNYIANYPERSFMYSSVKKLKRAGLIQSTFNVTLRSNL